MCVFVHIADHNWQQVLKHLKVKVHTLVVKPVGHEHHHLHNVKAGAKKIKEGKRPGRIRASLFHHLLRKARKKHQKRHKKHSHETAKSF